jgi:hypothetical protein
MAFLNEPKLLKRVKTLWGKEIELYRKNIIRPILHNEYRYNDTHYCFYHAQQPVFQLIHDLTKELYTHLIGPVPEDFVFLRFWQNAVEQNNVNDFIDAQENGNHTMRWYNRIMAEKILSLNIALFGNLKKNGECSFYYFLQNYSVNNNFKDKGLHDSLSIAKHLIQEILTKLNLDSSYANRLSELVSLLQAPTGNLFQIFIPKNKVDDWVYICHGSSKYGFGTPYRNNTLSNEPLIQAAYSQTKNRFTKISPILEAYRKNPQVIDRMDTIQARLVFVPETLDPRSGLKIIKFSTIPAINVATYQAKLKAIIHEMLNLK